MIVVCGNDAEVGEWVSARIPHMPTGFKDFSTLSVQDDGKLIAAVVYHEYRGNDIQMSVAADRKQWMSRSVLSALFDYPFNQLRCDRVTAMTPKNAAFTRRFLLGVGFVEEGNLRRGFLRDDCIIFGMLREECRWLRNHNG